MTITTWIPTSTNIYIMFMQLDGNRYNNYIMCPPTPMTTSTVRTRSIWAVVHRKEIKKIYIE